MTVEEAVEQLLEFPLESDLVICAHEWGMEDVIGWNVTHFAVTDDQQFTMIEGARPIGEEHQHDEATGTDQAGSQGGDPE